jgi:protein-S-isoprenylcysteine O-methyltransferase Ste14
VSALLARIYVTTLLVVWLGYGGWTTARTYRRGGRQDRGSRLVFVLGIFSPFAVAFLVGRAGVGALGLGIATALAWVGGTVMLGGIVLWMVAISTLGEYFSVNVDIPEDHRLVDTGVYARVRHPAYAGMLVTMLGYGIASGNWVVACVFPLIPTAAFLHRIRVEEQALVAHLGSAYTEYMERTRRFVPFVY